MGKRTGNERKGWRTEERTGGDEDGLEEEREARREMSDEKVAPEGHPVRVPWRNI